MMSRTPKKNCQDCPAGSVVQDNEARRQNLIAAYDAVVDSQKTLQCVVNEPGKYKQGDIKNFYGMAVQGMEALRDIEECATEFAIPLTDRDIAKAKSQQVEYVEKLKEAAETDEDD